MSYQHWTKRKGIKGRDIGFWYRGRQIIMNERHARGEKCERCLSYLGPFVWHHRNPEEKKFTIKIGSAREPSVIRAELAKCDYLCSRCHQKAHSRPRAKGKARIK